MHASSNNNSTGNNAMKITVEDRESEDSNSKIIINNTTGYLGALQGLSHF